MSYTIYYSDPVKASNPILINDGTKNIQATSLELIGRNYPGYGQAIATNLVHLLENFSSSSPPNNPIEGQIWFDTSDPTNKKLRVNDGSATGSNWSPVNGVYQQSTQPSSVKIGDIWVDTANQQMKIYNGREFVLVGPNVSSNTITGSYPETVTDITGNPHEIIINYVDGNAISVISQDTFVPYVTIDGFSLIESGVNLSETSILNGNAKSSYNLAVTSPSIENVSANSFLRNDIPQKISRRLDITVDSEQGGTALGIGTNPTFTLSRRNQYDAVFSNEETQGRFSFEVTGAGAATLVIDGSTKTVQVNAPSIDSSSTALSVYGSISATYNGSFQKIVTNSTASDSIIIAGGARVGGNLTVIGSIVGRVSSATSLTSPSVFAVNGDMTAPSVSFSGAGNPVLLTVTASNSLIIGKPITTVTSTTDMILIFSTGTQTLNSQTKSAFLRDINYNNTGTVTSTPFGSLVPVGTMMPYAGSTSTNAPAGWLWCDGSLIPTATVYSALRTVINGRYGNTGGVPKLPNLTGLIAPSAVAINYIVKY